MNYLVSASSRADLTLFQVQEISEQISKFIEFCPLTARIEVFIDRFGKVYSCSARVFSKRNNFSVRTASASFDQAKKKYTS